jgi:hypothetical protein
MANKFSLESIQSRLEEIEKERELLLQLIALHTGEPPKTGKSVSFSSPGLKSNTIRGRVVDATIELIHKIDRHDTNEEVLQFVEEKKISLGKTEDKAHAIGAILSQECEKKSARLKRVARGVYDIK